MKNDERLTFGFLINYLTDDFQQTVQKGAFAYTTNHNINFLSFLCRTEFINISNNYQYNIIKHLLTKKNLDGIIINTGIMYDAFTVDTLTKYIHSIKNVPVVTISMPVEDIPCVSSDNESGIHEAVDHLVTVHGLKKIAFVKGLENNYDAEKRFSAYCDSLKRNNLPVDETYIAPGNFSPESGQEAVRNFLDVKKIRPEAIITADDRTALGVIQELQHRKINIPADIAVIGFDDINEAKQLTPPLTTISQPIFDLGYKSAQLLHRKIMQKPIDNHLILPSRLKIRQSCGCGTSMFTDEVHDNTASMMTVTDKHKEFLDNRDRILNYLTMLTKKLNLDRNKKTDYLNAIVNAIEDFFKNNTDKYTLLTILSTFITDLNNDIDDTYLVKDIIKYFENNLLANLAPSKEKKDIEHLLLEAHLYIDNTIYRAQNYYNEVLYENIYSIFDITSDIITTFDFETLPRIIINRLALLGITTFFLALYQTPFNNNETVKTLPPKSKIIINYNNQKKSDNSGDTEYFETTDIFIKINKMTKQPQTLILIPLCFNEEQFGYFICDIQINNLVFYNTLRRAISSAYKGAFLLQTKKQEEKKLTVANTHLINRARENKRLNIKLLSSYNELDSKNSFKSQYLANMSHEIRSPLHSIIGNNDYLLYSNHILTDNLYGLNTQLLDQLATDDTHNCFEELKQFLTWFEENIFNHDYQIENYYFITLEEKLTRLIAIRNEIQNNTPLFNKMIQESHALINEVKEIINNDEKLRYENITNIKNSSQYLLHLINSLLDINKIETGKIEINKKEINIHHFINDILKYAYSYRKAKNKEDTITISHTIRQNTPDILFFDSEIIKEILLNLISNAIKFTHNGSVSLITKFRKDMIIFSIQDTGIGIKDDELYKLFKEFSRTTSAQGIEGTGLGLALTKKLVEEHGGKIKVTSEYNKGSNFSIYIPQILPKGSPHQQRVEQ